MDKSRSSKLYLLCEGIFENKYSMDRISICVVGAGRMVRTPYIKQPFYSITFHDQLHRDRLERSVSMPIQE